MKYVAVVITLVVMAVLVMEFNSRTAELNRLRDEQEAVNDRLEIRHQTYSALEAQMAYATSDAAVIEWAYENHMAKPGDLVVAPQVVGQVTPTPTVAPAATATPLSNRDLWLQLFFDLVE